jgi:hypothetical protein
LKITKWKAEAVNRRTRQRNGQKGEKVQTTIYKTLHIKLMIKQHEPYKKPGVNSDAPEGLAVPAPHVTPVVVLLNDTNIIRYENRVGHQYTKINTNNINKTFNILYNCSYVSKLIYE